jgi:hypothetical protein
MLAEYEKKNIQPASRDPAFALALCLWVSMRSLLARRVCTYRVRRHPAVTIATASAAALVAPPASYRQMLLHDYVGQLSDRALRDNVAPI